MDVTNLQVIRESFGRVVYTHKTHEKAAEIEDNKSERVKWVNIILTSLTSLSLISSFFNSYPLLYWSSTILSIAALAFVVYQLSFNPEQQSERHRQTAKELWVVREKYVSLLADIKNSVLSPEETRKQRDRLTEELKLIYKFAPQTTSAAYTKAQVALQINEELTFSDKEINAFLPESLRMDGKK